MSPLQEDSKCSWCQSDVVKGASVCKYCNAEHSYIIANPLLRLVCPLSFIVGIFIAPISLWAIFQGDSSRGTLQEFGIGVLALTIYFICRKFVTAKSIWRRKVLKSKY